MGGSKSILKDAFNEVAKVAVDVAKEKAKTEIERPFKKEK